MHDGIRIAGGGLNGHALQRAQRIPGIEENRRNRARYIQSERFADEIRQQALNFLRNLGASLPR
jgi:hypothetical protein